MLYSESPAASYTFTWPSGGEGEAILFAISKPDPNPAVAAGNSVGSGTTATVSFAVGGPGGARVPGYLLVSGVVSGTAGMSDPAGLTRVTSLTGADNLTRLTVWSTPVAATPMSTYTTSWTGATDYLFGGTYVQPQGGPAADDPTVTLTWNAAPPSTAYTVTRNDGATFAAGAATTYVDTTAVKATAYTYRVSAAAGTWTSAASDPVAVAAC